MSNRTPNIEELAREAETLTPEQAEGAQGGFDPQPDPPARSLLSSRVVLDARLQSQIDAGNTL
jgi:hypothetical protein